MRATRKCLVSKNRLLINQRATCGSYLQLVLVMSHASAQLGGTIKSAEECASGRAHWSIENVHVAALVNTNRPSKVCRSIGW